MENIEQLFVVEKSSHTYEGDIKSLKDSVMNLDGSMTTLLPLRVQREIDGESGAHVTGYDAPGVIGRVVISRHVDGEEILSFFFFFNIIILLYFGGNCFFFFWDVCVCGLFFFFL